MKLFTSAPKDAGAAIARLRRDAQAAGALGHPNIAAVLGVGDHEGQPWVATEFVPGVSLAQVLRSHAPDADRARARRLAAALRGPGPRAPRGRLPPRPQAGRRPPHPGRRGQGGGLRLVALEGARATGARAGRGGPALPRARDPGRAAARPQGRRLLGRRDRLRARLVPQGVPGRQHDRRRSRPDPRRARPRLPAPDGVHPRVRARPGGEPRPLARGAARLVRGRARRPRPARARHRAPNAQLAGGRLRGPSRARGAPRAS